MPFLVTSELKCFFCSNRLQITPHHDRLPYLLRAIQPILQDPCDVSQLRMRG